jgi:hypothetical protein
MNKKIKDRLRKKLIDSLNAETPESIKAWLEAKEYSEDKNKCKTFK